MPDNRLQIIAEMIDKVSPAAKKMQKSFDDLQKATARDFPAAFKKYQNAVTGNEKALAVFGKRSESTRREIKAFQDLIVRTSPVVGRLTEAIGGFTLGTGAAIGAVAAIGAAMVVAGKSAADFAASMKELKFGSAESGLGITQLHQMEQALDRFNIKQEDTVAAFKNLRAAMTEMSTDTGKFIQTIEPLGGAAVKLALPIINMSKAGKSTAEVFEKIADTVDEIKKAFPGAKGEDLARRFVQIFHLPGEFARIGGKELRETLDVVKALGATPEKLAEANVEAEKLNLELLKGQQILDAWKVDVEIGLIKGFRELIELAKELWGWLPKGWFRDADPNMSPGGGPGIPNYGDSSAMPDGGTPGGSGGPQGAGPRRYEGSSGGGAAPGGAPGGGGAAPGGGGGADTPFSSRFGTWSPASVGGHAGHIPSAATGPLGNTRTGGPNIGGPPLPQSRPSGAGGPPASNANPNLTGGGATGIDRSRWLAELNANPAMKDELYRHAIGENTDPLANQAVMEEAANRADIRTQIKGGGGFGSHHNLSYFKGYRGYSAREKAMMDENFRKVFEEGSDISRGAIDNSSQGLAWVHEHGGQMGGYGYPGLKPGRFGTSANFGGDRITGHSGVESFEVPGWGESMTGERAAYPLWRQQQLANTGPMARLNLNQALSGGQGTQITGGADLNVNVRAPSGTGVTARQQGIFKNLNLKRHVQMEPSSGGPPQSIPFAGAL